MAARRSKVMVAVHGIGDQIGYETVQSVAMRISAYYGIAPAVPLGHFYPAKTSPGMLFKPAPRLMQAPADPEALVGLGFAEVYWAGIAREPETAGFVLEEAKKWARTISARLSLRAGQAGQTLPAREQYRLVTVIDQLIETIFILERLSYLPEKAGLFKFSLRTLLENFVGDVQIVADFQAYRQRILDEFDQVMTQAAALGPADAPAEIFLVAHSEGSVVAFLALLHALAAPEQHPWIHAVKGVMTIGSPIETHHLLWPELWQQAGPDFTGLHPDPGAPRDIPWHNYFDRGDPIAYGLTDTCGWLETQGFGAHLRLQQTAFSRSLLPGKAHTDYWQDDEVFGHFIETLVKLDPPKTGKTRSFAHPPTDKLSAVVGTFVIPQALILATLLAATYLLYRPVSSVLYPTGLPSWTIVRDVTGIGLLLLGITAAGRLPRLTHEWRWWTVSAVLLALSMGVYSNVTCSATRRQLGIAFAGTEALALAAPQPGAAEPWWSDGALIEQCATDQASEGYALAAIANREGKPLSAERAVVERARWHAQVHRGTRGVLIVAGLLALVAGIFSSWSPYWGVRLLPSLGVASAVALVFFLLRAAAANTEIWPVVLGGAAFFYLWWLATLLFDLVFVWQRYVRHSAAHMRVSELSREGYKPTTLERALDKRATAS